MRGGVAGKEVGSKENSLSVGALFVFFFKMRAPWGCLNAAETDLGERQI